jgi:NADPH:quinone reductase-like Zn-dependent oxidoreductase
MKAIVCTKYGPPGVLRLKEVEKPTPKDNEVLITIHATTVNRTDCGTLRAEPFIIRFFTGIFKPNSPILGTDFAGKIEAVGKNVSSFKVGDKVFGFDDNGLGSHAQYRTISEDKALTTIPKNMTYEEAAAVPVGGLEALHFLRQGNIQSGQKVLMNGAGSGVGTFAVQIAKSFGVEVTCGAGC